MWVSRHHSGGVAPFGVSGINACMQLPRNVSPVSASFFGPKRQGIHPVLCVACSFFLLFPLLMEWISVSSLAEVLSKIEGIMFSCECAFFFVHPCFRCLHNMPQIVRLVNSFFGIFS